VTTQPKELPKPYNPKLVEDKWYAFWEGKGYFTPQIDPEKQPFVIIMPPPNVTGELHLGHAITATLEDIMTRWHRMLGEPTLWLPGSDHAGIATQVVVEQQLAQEGLTRQQLGRERFEERVWQWVNQCKPIIHQQHRRLGASCDWTRERFTLDEGPSRAVRTAFVNLYNKGLIYRGERIINWCPRCATALSDLEVVHKEISGHLYHVKYPLEDGTGFVTVATTRPETIMGDTAVAVNPEDERYKRLIGKRVILPAVGRHIPVIADEAVDPKFGTGCLKITPAHDPTDFEVGQRHGLEIVNTMNDDATMNERAGPYAGLDRFACREAILADLKRDGLLVNTEPYQHSIGHCQRCQTALEPKVSQQWFIKIAPLAQPAIDAVVDGRIKIVPERFTRVYLNWMENIRDWCISRQLWWGHRIPVWYCHDCGGLTVTVEEPRVCQHCASDRIHQDPDVLDTWFSSGLWPLSTLGWPEATRDLDYFYPTSVMETGYDILFFWVARMIMLGMENTGEVPFRTIFLHGLIRDEAGEKMSKVRGNVINPIEAIEKYGTDALRFALTTGTAPGNDSRLSWHKLEASRNFVNKLWNASRFVLRSLQPGQVVPPPSGQLPVADRWIWSRLNRLVDEVGRLMADYQFGEAQQLSYDFIWSEYCDWYIELAKIRLRQPAQPSPLPTLVYTLEICLRLLHPYMPFVTEEVWQHLKPHLPPDKRGPESIMIAPYPEADKSAFDPEAERHLKTLTEVVRSLRNLWAEFGIPPQRWLQAEVYASNEVRAVLQEHLEAMQILARTRPITILDRSQKKPLARNAMTLVLEQAEAVVPLEGMVDFEAERERLRAEIRSCQAFVEQLRKKLDNQAFLDKAPAEVVQRERDKLAANQDRLRRLEEQLSRIS